MSIARGLRDYLLTSERLSGHANKPFARAQVVGQFTCSNRNDAREALRSLIGDRNIFLNRRPQKATGSAIVIRVGDVERENGLAGDESSRTEYLTATIVAEGENYGDRTGLIAELLGLCVSGWSGGYWGEQWVGECIIESESASAVPVGDGSDRYSWSRDVDLRICWVSSAAIYSATNLVAGFEFLTNPGQGTSLQLANVSTIPDGRALELVQWDLRVNATGAILVTFSGNPSLSLVADGLSGTYGNPVIDRDYHGLPGNVHVTLTVTDDTGDTDSAVGSQTVESPDPSPAYNLGMNLSEFVYSGSSQRFLDLGLSASPFTANVGGGVVDENTGDHTSGVVQYRFFANETRSIAQGTYNVSYTGAATGPSSFVVGPTTNQIDLSYDGAASGISIRRAGTVGDYESSFVTRSAVGSCFRFMRALRVNREEYQDTHPYVRVNVEASNTFYHKLPDPARMRAICEDASGDGRVKDCWICLHHAMSDTQIEAVVNAFSGFTGTLYLEHSNEVWNSSFPQYAYALAAANSSGNYTGAPGDAAKIAAWHADRTDTIGALVKAVDPTVNMVLGMWLTQPNQASQIQTYQVRDLSNVDSVAVAPYVGTPVLAGIDDGVLNAASDAAIVAYGRQDFDDRVKGKILDWVGYADTLSLDLIAYEGGLSFVKNDTVETRLTEAANSDAAASLLQDLLGYWKDNTNNALFNLFEDVQADTFGHWQYEHDAPTPRAQLFLDLA